MDPPVYTEVSSMQPDLLAKPARNAGETSVGAWIATGRNWNHRGQRLVCHARAHLSARSEGRNSFWRAERRLCAGRTRGPEGRLSGAAWPGPQAASFGAEFSGKH